MSAPTPQEIRDRLARVETVLKDAHTELAMREGVSPDIVAAFLDAKTNILQATALTLLVEAQQVANKITACQVLATANRTHDALSTLEKIQEEYGV